MKHIVIITFLLTGAFAQETHQATGVKVGEVTPTSAIVWMRVTRNPARNQGGLDLRGKGGDKTVPPGVAVDSLEGAAPGAPGRVRFRYGEREDLSGAKATPWMEVYAGTDFAQQFRIRGLKPGTKYYYAADTAGPGGSPRHAALTGSFTTAPPPEEPAEVTFTVVTGMMYADLDDPAGFNIYASMPTVNPRFLIPTGDTVYYDSDDPRVTSEAVARYHWQRMYSLPRLIAFHLRVPGYWEKDDHDTYANDCWPGQKVSGMGSFTFEQGQRIFLQEVPMGERTYRKVRWGKRLEVWLTEGRDFRSPNDAPDGPAKTLWGKRQKQWLKKTLLASDAEWKVLVSPTPIVGPDRPGKADNQSDPAFAHEGNQMRQWFAAHLPRHFFIVCGDRHVQYHSVDPKTGVQEFACGPASDRHAGGSAGPDPRYHRFYRAGGGFLSVSVSRDGITFRHHDVRGRVLYQYSARP